MAFPFLVSLLELQKQEGLHGYLSPKKPADSFICLPITSHPSWVKAGKDEEVYFLFQPCYFPEDLNSGEKWSMFFSEYKFQSKTRRRQCPSKPWGYVSEMLYSHNTSFQPRVGAVTLGSLQPQLCSNPVEQFSAELCLCLSTPSM